MKAVLLLNGGSALALLPFFGSRPRMLSTVATEAVGNALFSFGIGTTGSVMVFLCAYLTQLHYGNEGTEIRPGRQGVIWHNLAYGAVAIAVGLRKDRNALREQFRTKHFGLGNKS
ncbi:hypothetical protein AB7828_29505 [Tardiphaga sp. 215_C5_N2_1]|uniref:hypothetical protein n=1 Tax=Tardiphaga sp. 215_C5_N2_1 TaxID=3240774 RepID=UPI003F88A13B